MPAEWDRHERTVMSWPVNERIWGDIFDQAKDEYAQTARAIARFEPLLMVVNPGDEGDAARRCGSQVEIVAFPIDDSWMRDSGPIITRDADGSREGVHFRFNAYGGRFQCEKDANVAAHVLEHLQLPERRSDMVLEGGSISVDGVGTLITTEQCLLNANRNPGYTRDEIEGELCSQLGVEKVVWLRWGRIEDMHTDGHVDLVCMFVRPGVVIAQGCAHTTNPNYERLQSNLRTLRASTDARGRRLEVIELPLLPMVRVAGQQIMVCNANFYLVNGAVIVPLAGSADDAMVLEIFKSACPDREVVGVPGSAIALGGGGAHCITQQIPAVA